MFTPIQLLLSAQRHHKRMITLLYDVFALMFSLYAAIALRLDTLAFTFSFPEFLSMMTTVGVTLYCFVRLGMYRAVLRYMMLPAIGYIFLSVIISAVTLALSGFFFQAFIPRSVPFIYAGLATLTLGGPRILFAPSITIITSVRNQCFIYGAGSTGRDLAYALIQGDEYHPVIFLDDDPAKTGQIIFGLRVHHSSDFESLRNLYEPVKMLIAINNIGKNTRINYLNDSLIGPLRFNLSPQWKILLRDAQKRLMYKILISQICLAAHRLNPT